MRLMQLKSDNQVPIDTLAQLFEIVRDDEKNHLAKIK